MQAVGGFPLFPHSEVLSMEVELPGTLGSDRGKETGRQTSFFLS